MGWGSESDAAASKGPPVMGCGSSTAKPADHPETAESPGGGAAVGAGVAAGVSVAVAGAVTTIAAPYVVLGIVSIAGIGRTQTPWRGLNILIGVSSLGLGGASYGVSRPFRRGFLKNKFQRDRIIQGILE